MAVLHFCLFDDSLSLHNYRDGVFAKIGAEEIGVAKFCLAEIGVCEICFVEISSVEVGSTEVGIIEISYYQFCATEIGSTEVSFSEVSFAEVGSSEIGTYISMLFSPGVPVFNSLSKQIKVLLICHSTYLHEEPSNLNLALLYSLLE